jgi:hypothetical protein
VNSTARKTKEGGSGDISFILGLFNDTFNQQELEVSNAN